MAGTLTISTLSDGTNSTSSTNIVKGACNAFAKWSNPSGTTVTIASSYNVSSITASATNDFTVNFTNALSNANYVVVGTAGQNTTNLSNFTVPQGTTAPTTSGFRCQVIYQNAGLAGAGTFIQFMVVNG
jgi:hypothetical protein